MSKIVFHIQYATVASTALMVTVFAFWLFFPCIFINYCDYRVFHREFLWLVVANKCQMSSDINILYHSYQDGLNTKRSLHARLNFMFLVQLLISLWLVMTCVIPSQMAYSFYYFNGSHSMHCSSVEAYLLWKCCCYCFKYVFSSHQIVRLYA